MRTYKVGDRVIIDRERLRQHQIKFYGKESYRVVELFGEKVGTVIAIERPGTIVKYRVELDEPFNWCGSIKSYTWYPESLSPYQESFEIPTPETYEV